MSWWRIPPSLSWFTLFRRLGNTFANITNVEPSFYNCEIVNCTYTLLSISCLALILYFVDQVVCPVNSSVPKILKRLVSQVFQVPKRKYKVWLHNCYIICVKYYFQSSVRGTSGQSPDRSLWWENATKKPLVFSKNHKYSVKTYLVNIFWWYQISIELFLFGQINKIISQVNVKFVFCGRKFQLEIVIVMLAELLRYGYAHFLWIMEESCLNQNMH